MWARDNTYFGCRRSQVRTTPSSPAANSSVEPVAPAAAAAVHVLMALPAAEWKTCSDSRPPNRSVSDGTIVGPTKMLSQSQPIMVFMEKYECIV